MSVRITQVSGRLVEAPPSMRWSDSTHDVSNLEYVFAEISGKDGSAGIGWSYTLGVGGRAILALLETIAPRLIGATPDEATGLLENLLFELHLVGQGGITSLAVAALDIAVWDLRAKARGVPLYDYWGRRKNDHLAYASGIDIHLSTTELERRVAGYIEAGYRAVKIKIGHEDAQEDVARVRAVRKLVGPSCLLMVDANQRWNPGETIRRSRLLEDFDLFWLEEPVPADDIEAHARAKSGMRIPLASGETVFTVRESIELIERSGADIIQTDVARVGGFTQWLKIAHAAAARTLPMAPHFLFELSIQGMCAIENPLIAEYVYGGTFTDLGFLREPLRPINGRITAPAGPGLGLEFDFQALDRQTKGTFTTSVHA